MRWGLVPHWAKDESIGAKLNNARSEGMADKPSFRQAVRRRRCLLPASGFYEWQATPHGQAALVHQPAQGGPSSPWPGCSRPGGRRAADDADWLLTCCVITTAPMR